MLNCKLCDYYHSLSGEDISVPDLAICDFADLLFLSDVENMDIEYPCSKLSFEAYLQEKPSVKISPESIRHFVKPDLYQELRECGVFMLKFPEGIIGKCFRKSVADECSGRRKVQMESAGHVVQSK